MIIQLKTEQLLLHSFTPRIICSLLYSFTVLATKDADSSSNSHKVSGYIQAWLIPESPFVVVKCLYSTILSQYSAFHYAYRVFYIF